MSAPQPLDGGQLGLRSQFKIGDYELRAVLGSSITGITYSAWDHGHDTQVVIKEFLPAGSAIRREDGSVAPPQPSAERAFANFLEQFLVAATALAGVGHQNIVRVLSVTESNGTGYVAMEHAEGETLDTIVWRSGALAKPQLDAMLPPLLDALEAMHDAGLLHLALRPDKIVLGADGSPIVLAYGATQQGFTAARQILDRSKGVRLLHSPSLYAPVELYSRDAKWGQWTDIYSLAAVLYECVSGKAPPSAPDRLIDDSIVPLHELDCTDCDPAIISGIQAALDPRPAGRPQEVAAWRHLLTPTPRAPGVTATLAKTSARGASLATRSRSTRSSRNSYRRVRWAVPVLALGAAASLITYLDTSYLRSPSDTVALGRQTTDLRSPIERLADRGGNPALPVVTPVSDVGGTPEDEPPVVEPAGFARLSVETDPASAEVWLAGRFVGRTPLVLEGQAAGVFDVVLNHPHCESVVLADQLFEDHEELRISEVLTRGKGNLMVTTEPTGAWVEFNGRRLIESTPGLLRDLPAGPVELTVGAPGRKPVKVFAEVPKDGTRYLAQTLATSLKS